MTFLHHGWYVITPFSITLQDKINFQQTIIHSLTKLVTITFFINKERQEVMNASFRVINILYKVSNTLQKKRKHKLSKNGTSGKVWHTTQTMHFALFLLSDSKMNEILNMDEFKIFKSEPFSTLEEDIQNSSIFSAWKYLMIYRTT